ncbi:unnamed protein product [Triticum turgidum subsp. durum]|uniref:Uncharacterized protein n=1 Tax=Triticum turgidum subsp. durum TaxID=4567 RepID=A0A9R1NR78_TRITD|nr:unnamed protein product [Triticum turgidum subsp. durum]
MAEREAVGVGKEEPLASSAIQVLELDKMSNRLVEAEGVVGKDEGGRTGAASAVRKEHMRWRRGQGGLTSAGERVNKDGLRAQTRLDNAMVAVGRGRGRISLKNSTAAPYCYATPVPA